MHALIPRDGLRAFLSIALGRLRTESWELRLSEMGEASFHPDVRARDYPEVRGVVGYAAQFIQPEEWTIFDGEAFAAKKSWRLFPRAIEAVVLAAAVLVGQQSGTLYAVQPLDAPLVLTPTASGGGAVDLDISLHLLLRPLADVLGART